MECMMKLWILVFALLPVTVYADTEVIEKYKFYIVSASAANYLLTSLNLESPVRENGDIYHANTQYQLKTRFWWRKDNGLCRLAKTKTVLKLNYTLPKLNTKKRDVLAVWQQWYPHLYTHEKGHGSLAKQTAETIDKQLLAIKAHSKSASLKIKAQSIAQKEILKLKQSFKDYDLKTNHGETQGAWIYAYL